MLQVISIFSFSVAAFAGWWRTLLFTVGLLAGALVLRAAPAQPFLFNSQAVPPGQKRCVRLAVQAGRDSTSIPVTVLHGRRPGPVLGIIAGVHGYEYAPIVAVQQLAQALDPAQLSGTVLLVHLANVPGFFGRRLQVNPVDGLNLNRTFPGRPDGSLTERLAWQLSEQVIARCTHLVDVHAGDGHEELRPYAGYYEYTATPVLGAQGRQLAAALGLPFVVQFGNEPRWEGPSLYCSREAVRRGIPAADIECGGLGQATPGQVQQIRQALGRLLGHLHLTAAAPAPSPTSCFIARRTFLTSAYTGCFYPAVKAGELVYQGQALGTITDLFGRPLAEVTAPATGVLLYLTATPPITAGESLGTIGHLAE